MLRNESPEHLLEHPLRTAIVDEVRARPGVSFLQLQKRVLTALGRSPAGQGTMSHHVQHLERARLLVSKRAGRHRRFFLPQHARAAPRLSVLWDPEATRLLDLLSAHPGLGQTQIARAMGRARPNLSRLLARLHEAGLVQRVPARRAPQFWPASSTSVSQTGFPQSIHNTEHEPQAARTGVMA